MNFIKGIRLNKAPEPASYLSGLPIIQYLGQIDRLTFEKPVTFFVGENGTGKSTLIEAIAAAMGFDAEGGSRDHAFSASHTGSELSELITVIKTTTPKDGFFLRAESFFNMAAYLDESASIDRYGGVYFHEQSHGESFISLIQNRFVGQGLYILDEPEAALSPQKLLSLIAFMDGLVKQNAQFMIATHSPILMAYPNAEILQLSDAGIQKVRYRETEHYQITKMFLDDPERMLHYLLGPDDR